MTGPHSVWRCDFASRTSHGRGMPAGARGEQIPLPARVLHVARDAAALAAEHGAEAAAAEVARRAGAAYEPEPAALVRSDWLDELAGQPAAALPLGLGEHGLPVAVQLVGRTGAERTLLALAAQVERARPWAQLRPPEELE